MEHVDIIAELRTGRRRIVSDEPPVDDPRQLTLSEAERRALETPP